MRIGLVSSWCNRGQGVVTRQVREIFEEAGHETHVLARPLHENSPLGSFIDEGDDWKVPRLTRASGKKIYPDEYLAWAESTGIQVMFTDQSSDFAGIAALREAGVNTVGRFVWEKTDARSARRAARTYRVLYSLTLAEQARYARWGIDSPRVRWGIHPSMIRDVKKCRSAITFIFHGGNLGRRKPVQAAIQAFRAARDPDIRLIIKSQAVKDNSEPVDTGGDERIEHVNEDMTAERYVSFYGSCHVSLAPARWEGLGVHLYESIGLGMPVISNDIPPINEVIEDGVSGLLVDSTRNRERCGWRWFLRNRGEKRDLIPIYDPDIPGLTRAIEELSDPHRLKQLQETTAAARGRFDWAHTVSDYLALADRARPGASSTGFSIS